MNDQIIFNYLSTLMFGVLTIMMAKNNWMNTLIKSFSFILFVAGCFICLKAAGYIIRM
jgi:multidrug efflux pump subunit AcrB